MKVEDTWTFETVDMSQEVPAPKFEHFEQVVISGREQRSDYHGERGTIIWLDSSAVRRTPAVLDQWLYVVHFPTRATWATFLQADLESDKRFDPEAAHLGSRPEISFDTVLEDDNGWVEGSYRLPGLFWEVVIFKRDDVSEMQCQPSVWKRPTRWERQITGVVIRFPRAARMGRTDLLQALSKAVGFNEWVEVRGPNSMMLR